MFIPITQKRDIARDRPRPRTFKLSELRPQFFLRQKSFNFAKDATKAVTILSPITSVFIKWHEKKDFFSVLFHCWAKSELISTAKLNAMHARAHRPLLSMTCISSHSRACTRRTRQCVRTRARTRARTALSVPHAVFHIS